MIILLTIVKAKNIVIATAATVIRNRQSDILIYRNHHGQKNEKVKKYKGKKRWCGERPCGCPKRPLKS